MSRMSTSRISLPCISAIMFFLLGTLLQAQEKRPEEVRLANLDWSISGNTVVISYDLIAPPENLYAVSVVLLREDDRAFKLVPKSLSGHVGEGKYSGQARQIRWAYRQDVPQGLSGDRYYFEIHVYPVTGTSPWLYVGLGAVAAAGGAAAILLSSKKEEAPGGPGQTELPSPPTRPNQ
ncbi:MAG: hypothetical protein FJ215_11475 [Ignavibacteria bacterium]|nr:hypothetical protein [Ignavibacteria bacterium]